MKHIHKKIPAYACGKNVAACKHTFKGSHGYHNEEWIYVVVSDEGDAALVLRVGSGIYTTDTPPMGDEDKPEAYSWVMHVNYPTDREEVKHGEPSSACEYVCGGKCTSPYSSGIDAQAFFVHHFDKASGYEQENRFWNGLELKLAELMGEFSDASLRWSKCVHCDATGTVRR